MTTILETKLQPPRARTGALARGRLTARVDAAPDARLVLVSAPPGFGKTTFIEQWIETLPHPGPAVAWLSLDAGDDEPAVFWSYVVAAIATASPAAAEDVAELIAAGETRVDLVVAALVNGLAAIDTDLILVLDDLHAIERREIHDGLALLLERLPPRTRLAILTRADPPLPLARMRVRGELVEIRAAELRFTSDEAAAYLDGQLGERLADADVAALEERTEGWVAALQLAVLSMRGRDDVASFIAAFAGDDRYVVDYLADEVLERQPDDIREFLLGTSILDRLTGQLCDALTAGAGGAAMLERLERANLFLVPLDDRRRWYRYHHLFADLLRARLLDQRPGDVAALHRRAADWWAAHDEPAEAIHHALAGADFEHAADLIELAARELRRTRQELTLRRWLDVLPDALFAHRPVLAIAHAGALLSTGEAAGVEARLAAAERWVPAAVGGAARAAAEAEGMIVRHETALSHLPGAIALYRAALARMQGNLPRTIEQARIALAAATEDQPLERGSAAGLLALAQWADGDLEVAYETWSAAAADLERAGHRADVLGGTLAMADIRAAQGRLADAQRTLERGLRFAADGDTPLRGTADMHVALAELDRERNELDAARAHLAEAASPGDSLGLPQYPWRSRVAAAGTLAAEGDLDTALGLLDEAERVYVPDFFPDVRPIAALRARLWTRQGRNADAVAWAREQGLTPDDELAYLREYEHVTLAAALLEDARTRGSREGAADAGRFIDRLLEAAEAGGRGRSVIELLILRAAASSASGDRDGTAAALDRALALAEPEGFVRLFLDHGPAIEALLRDASKRAAAPEFARRLLEGVGSPRRATSRSQPLIEPLSERELEVLRLLATDLDGPEIASQLYVSLNTLRTHTKHIFGKLGVSSRRAAVSRAAELDLLTGDR